MPRKKRTIIEETLPEVANPELIDGTTGEPIMGSDLIIAYTKVYRITQNRRAFCFQSDVSVDEPAIQQRYPDGGQFVLEDYTADHQLLAPKTIFNIEPQPQAVTVASSNPNGSMADFQIRLLMDELNHNRQMLRDALNKAGGGGSSIVELTTALANLKGIAGDGPNMMDVLLKGISIGSKGTVGGADAEPPDWKAQIISGIKEVAVPLIGATMNRSTASIPNPNQLPPASTEEKPEMLERLMIQQGIKWVKNQILTTNLDPELAAEWMLSNANDATYRPFIVKAATGTVDDFMEYDKEVGNEPFRAWFTKVISIVKEAYAQQSSDTSDNGGGNGNGSNASTDAAVGVGKSKLTKVG